MTIKELKKLLEKFDDDKEIRVWHHVIFPRSLDHTEIDAEVKEIEIINGKVYIFCEDCVYPEDIDMWFGGRYDEP